MDYQLISTNPDRQRTDCLIIGIYNQRKLPPTAHYLDKFTDGYLNQILKQGDLPDKLGATLLIPHPPALSAKRLLLVNCGDGEKPLSEQQFRTVHLQAANALKTTQAKTASFYLVELPVDKQTIAWKIRQAIIYCASSLYQFTALQNKKNTLPLSSLSFNVANKKLLDSNQIAITQGAAIAEGMDLSRELSNLPGNVCTPRYLAKQAEIIAKQSRKLSCKILDEAEMKKLKMGALLSVSQGSAQPARLIILHYKGAKVSEKPVVLVGKGITFDSGGISLKPGAKMDEMKFDMCGAASILGSMQAVASMQLPINVVAVIATSENLPGGSATKPGDVVTSMSGQTIEVLNTDAEGRLVLCDALTYCERFKPKAVIDVATLTGAMMIALGEHASGIMTNHQPLVDALNKSADTCGDRIWQLPLWKEYADSLQSNFADMANIGSPFGASIIAGAFLEKFTKNFHWAHLDIAGIAWHTGKQKGATGRPVPLLTQYLLDCAEHATS